MIGAVATLADLADEPALGFLVPALETIASPAIRTMATVGGNLFAPPLRRLRRWRCSRLGRDGGPRGRRGVRT